MHDLSHWQHLQSPEGEALLVQCAALDLAHPGSIQALRKNHSPELVAVAVELTMAREAARAKFGDRAASLFADREGVQMASSPAAASHKALRFQKAADQNPVLDLCSGIGADARALVEAGVPVHAFDLSPVRAWMTNLNAGCPTSSADVTRASLPPGLVHIDPQRRKGTERHLPRLDDLEPGFDFVRALMADRLGGCVKLFPGISFAELPPGEVEILSERGRLRQALLWTGTLARDERRATNLSTGASIAGATGIAAEGPIAHYLYAVDPAVERAELIGRLADDLELTAPHPSSGLLTSDAMIRSSFLTPFELLADLPWAPKRVRKALRDLGAGIVEVKTRGGIIDPDRVQREMRGDGSVPITLFVLRLGDVTRALVTRRIDTSTLTSP